MSQKKNIPKRRFKEFQDAPAWEQRKLESMATFSKGCGYSKSDLIDSGYEVILYGRLYTSYETVISSVNTYVELNDKSVISAGGEVIVPASGESPEDIARASVVEKEGMVLGGDLNIIRPKPSLDSVFLALSISNGSQKKELSKRAQGKSVVHLHNSDLKEVIILYPKVEEQSKISDLFISFDSLISLHQRKLDKLRALKESYLSKMFPVEGQDKPELRFKGFTDAWEQRKLGDVIDSFSGGTPSANNASYYGGNIPFIRSGEIKSETTELYLTEDGLKNSSAKLVEAGDILYALYGATSGEVAISRINGAINQAILAIRPYPGYSSKFLLQWLQLQKESIIEKYIQGGQGNLSGAIVKGLTIDFAQSIEQDKIGILFDYFDNLISLHQRKLDKLKSLKEAYLAEMFV